MFILLDLLNSHYKTNDYVAQTAFSQFVLYLEDVFLSFFFFLLSVKFMIYAIKC